MKKFQNKLPVVAAICLILVSAAYVRQEAVFFTAGESVSVEDDVKCVVIDAGHGGSK